MCRWCVLCTLVGVAFSHGMAYAQPFSIVLAQVPTLPLPQIPPPLPEKPLPPLPPPLQPPVVPPEKRERLPSLRVFVRAINVLGSTVFTPDEWAKVTAHYRHGEMTSEDREVLCQGLDLPSTTWPEFNNYQPPTAWAEQGLVTVADQNLTGLGDILSLQYGRSSGVDPILNFRYALPINAHDTTVSAQYRRFDLAVKEEPFK